MLSWRSTPRRAIERVSLDQTHDLWVDDNGYLAPGRPMFILHNHPFAGAG